MKRLTYIILLLTVTMFSFSQTNATFKNLDVRDKTHLRGLTDIDTTLHLHGLYPMIVSANNQWVLLMDSASGNVYKTKLTSLVDSLKLIDTTLNNYWTRIGNDIENTNPGKVIIDSTFILSSPYHDLKFSHLLAWLPSTGNVYPVDIGSVGDTSHENDFNASWQWDTTRWNWAATAIAYGDGKFVAVGDSIAWSEDGIHWEFANGNLGDSDQDMMYQAVEYGNGLFVAVGGGHGGIDTNIAISVNGKDWKLVSSQSNLADSSLYDVAYGNGKFVTVGNNNLVATSTNGVVWTKQTVPGDGDWDGVCYGGGLWVAVGDINTGEQIITSPDGITWTGQTIPVSGQDRAWWGIAYGNGMYVATATDMEDSTVMTSPDGVNWTMRLGKNNTSWARVIYADGRFVAAGNGQITQHIMSSPDGINWTLNDTIDYAYGIRDIAYGNGKFVGVNGAIRYSNGTLIKYDAATDNNFNGESNFNSSITLKDTARFEGIITSATDSDLTLQPAGTGNVSITSGLVLNKTVGYENLEDNDISTETVTIDWTLGNIQTLTLDDTVTVAFTAPPHPCHLTLLITHAANATVYPVTFPGTVLWSAGTAYNSTDASEAVDIVSFFYDGTHYFGMDAYDFKEP